MTSHTTPREREVVVMLQYKLRVNGETIAPAYFKDIAEVEKFFMECVEWGETVEVLSIKKATVQMVLEDEKLSHADMIEYLGMLVLPTSVLKKCRKIWQIEEELQRLGF